MTRSTEIPQFTDAASSHPLPIRALNRVGRLLPSSRPLTADSIWSEARRGALAECEPTPEARAALEVLLDSLAANARLSLVGRLAAKDDTLRIARTHLRVHRALRAAPAVAQVTLPPPVFIVGWPRTGSTFLHQLLACDPASRSIPYWESFDPVPPEPGEPDRRVAELARMLALLERIEPRYHAIHPMTAESAEECVALFMNEFRTLQFDFQYRVPEYVRWLLDQDAGIAYDGYRAQLQLIQLHRPNGRRQVLKDPTHLVHLDTLVEGFPDAKFVFTHRDPAVALSSICSLVAYTRALFTDDVDPRSIGSEMLSGHWPTALDHSRELRTKLPPGRAVDVRHPELLANPLDAVARIYAELRLDFTDEAQAAMRAFVAARSTAEGGKHAHTLAGFGLREAAVRERLARYCAEMDL